MSDESVKITITQKEYHRLVERDKLLQHLEENGVDNWEGYSRPPGEDDEEESYEDIYGEKKP